MMVGCALALMAASGFALGVAVHCIGCTSIIFRDATLLVATGVLLAVAGSAIMQLATDSLSSGWIMYQVAGFAAWATGFSLFWLAREAYFRLASAMVVAKSRGPWGDE